MLPSEEIRNKIDTVDTELETLQERRQAISKQLNMLTDSMAANGEENGSKSEIRDLHTDKEVLDEVIDRKKDSMAELQEQLKEAIGNETDEENYRQLVSLAEKSKQFREEYYEIGREIDQFLQDKMEAYSKARGNWVKNNKKFMRLADSMAKGFRQGSRRALVRAGRRGELKKADELVDKLEADGVDLDPVLSMEVMRSRYYNYLRNKGRDEEKYPPLKYGYYLGQMAGFIRPKGDG